MLNKKQSFWVTAASASAMLQRTLRQQAENAVFKFTTTRNISGKIRDQFHAALAIEKESRLYVIFPRFAGSDVLIQFISTTTHSLSNQILYWSNVAL